MLSARVRLDTLNSGQSAGPGNFWFRSAPVFNSNSELSCQRAVPLLSFINFRSTLNSDAREDDKASSPTVRSVFGIRSYIIIAKRRVCKRYPRDERVPTVRSFLGWIDDSHRSSRNRRIQRGRADQKLKKVNRAKFPAANGKRETRRYNGSFTHCASDLPAIMTQLRLSWGTGDSLAFPGSQGVIVNRNGAIISRGTAARVVYTQTVILRAALGLHHQPKLTWNWKTMIVLGFSDTSSIGATRSSRNWNAIQQQDR